MVLHCMATEFAAPEISSLSANSAQPALLSLFSVPFSNLSESSSRFYPTTESATFSDLEEEK